MADQRPHADSTAGTGDDAGAPRWVKVFALVALLLVAVVVLVLLTGDGGGHGPGRHAG